MNRSLARILPAAQPESLLEAARLLREGEVIAVPTDTVYGLAAAIFNEEAVERIYAIKRRPAEERFPILLASAADLPVLVADVSRTVWDLIERFWPGPLTLVLLARPSAPRWITRQGETVAVRVPAARSTLELLEVLGEPVVGTSANIHGHPETVAAEEVVAELGAEIAAIFEDDAAVTGGLPSTVVAVNGEEVTVLRTGAVAASEIREAVGGRVLVKAAPVEPVA